eukprot:76008_1
MYSAYVNKYGSAEIVYCRTDEKSNLIKEYIVSCDMNLAFGLLKNEAGNHIIKQRGNRTERFCKAIATVHVVPKKDETNKYGDLERYISDVQISTANEQLSTDYQVKHKQSG